MLNETICQQQLQHDIGYADLANVGLQLHISAYICSTLITYPMPARLVIQRFHPGSLPGFPERLERKQGGE